MTISSSLNAGVMGLSVNATRLSSISDNTWDRLNHLLYRVVNDKKGTGQLANPRINNLTVAGKTGTAQNPHGDPHAWFI